MTPRVVNAARARVGGYVLVDRSTDWGNWHRFRPGDLKGRRKAVAAYRFDVAHMITRKPGFLDKLQAQLAGKVLACWCRPLPCHAPILLAAANSGDMLR